MSRAHVEIAHLIRRIGRVLDDLDPAGPDDDDIIELRRLLYGLHAVLQLHFAQEDEGYLSLAHEHLPTIPTTTPDSRHADSHGPSKAAAGRSPHEMPERPLLCFGQDRPPALSRPSRTRRGGRSVPLEYAIRP